MITFTFLVLSILNLFVFFILYAIPIKLDLLFCMIFILVWPVQLTFCLTYLASYFHFEISQLHFILQMPISIGQWREEIGIFNSYKCKTPFKCVHSNFAVNLLLYKLITFMLLYCLHEILDYCDYVCKVLDCLLIFMLVTDKFAIQVLI